MGRATVPGEDQRGGAGPGHGSRKPCSQGRCSHSPGSRIASREAAPRETVHGVVGAGGHLCRASAPALRTAPLKQATQSHLPGATFAGLVKTSECVWVTRRPSWATCATVRSASPQRPLLLPSRTSRLSVCAHRLLSWCQTNKQWKGRQGTRTGCLCWLWLGGFLLFVVALTVLCFAVLMKHHPDWGLGSCLVRAAGKRAVGVHAEVYFNSAQNQVLGSPLQSQHAPKQKRGCSHTAVDRTVSLCSF